MDGRGDRLYCHVFENSIGPLPLYGLKQEQIQSIRRLTDGSEVPLSVSWVRSGYPDITFADLGPDPADTVLEIRLKPGALPEWS